jgi:hypothetical protein
MVFWLFSGKFIPLEIFNQQNCYVLTYFVTLSMLHYDFLCLQYLYFALYARENNAQFGFLAEIPLQRFL